MTEDSPRRYGGVGMAVWHASTDVSARRAKSGMIVIDGLEPDLKESLESRLRGMGLDGVHLTVHRRPPSHVGLGSKTSIILTCLESALLVSGINRSSEEIQRLAGRGGTSGIGCQSYFLGGVVSDGGHRNSIIPKFLPSSSGSPVTVPTSVFRVPWPNDWPLLLAIPPGSQSVSVFGQRELDFFRDNTPLPRLECADVAMAMFFELPAALMDADFGGFAEAVKRSRSCGFKAREVAYQASCRRLLEALDEFENVACSMSSFGPCVFIACKEQETERRVLELLSANNATVLEGTVANRGRIVARGGELSPQFESRSHAEVSE
jgi:beta-ribofuranosylaminobenzene 5'-phosphate synthase